MTTASGKKSLIKRSLGALSTTLELALEAVWPDRCLVCGRTTLGIRKTPFRRDPPLDALVCTKCQKALVVPPSEFCERCAAMIRPGVRGPRCGRCHDADYFFDEVRPLHPYYGLARSVVLRLKHTKDRALVEAIARLYFQSREKELRRFAPDCVVATPMNWRRKYFIRHGVNSPEGIAKRLAKDLRVPNMSRCVKRVRATAAQTSVEWAERAANIQGAFAVKNPAGAPVFLGKRVLLVDDAFTTGATTNEISRILLDAGAASVCVAVLTRAGLGKRPRLTNPRP